jgi:predicted TPR repeat methyltransferase
MHLSESGKVLKMSDEFALEYDNSAVTNHWHGPEVLFGLMYEYLSKGQLLLDIGIGTGLSARFFHQAEVQIYGVDGSDEMLKICREKGITIDLEKIDLTVPAEPFPDKNFDHIISNGVFHIIGDLEPVFKIVKSKLKPMGIVGFTLDVKDLNDKDGYHLSDIEGIYHKKHAQSGILVYKHHEEYILDMLRRFGFDLLKKLKFLAFHDEGNNISYSFTAYIARRMNA